MLNTVMAKGTLMQLLRTMFLLLLFAAPRYAYSQPATSQEGKPTIQGQTVALNEEELADHEAIIKMRESVIRSVNGDDLESLFDHLAQRCVVVWQNGETSSGHKEIAEYYNRMMRGEKARVKSFKLIPETFRVAEYSQLYGADTGIAYGTSECQFELNNGMKFVIKGPWSATMVKEERTWKIASFHASVGLFDNPILISVQKFFYAGCVIAAMVGVFSGVIATWLVRRWATKR